MAFSGEYQHSIDEKGRLIVPAQFRDSLGVKFMLQKGQEGCLNAYPMGVWTGLEEKLNALHDFSRTNRNLKRRFFSGSRECEIDRQGRALIQQEFRSYGKLTKEAYIVGAGDHVEIWDKETWESFRDSLDAEYEALAEVVFQ